MFLNTILETAYVILYILFLDFKKNIFGNPKKIYKEIKIWPIKSI